MLLLPFQVQQAQNFIVHYPAIYTYSYGNTSGYDLSRARGVEEFYALLRSSMSSVQYVQDINGLQTLFNDQTVIQAKSIGLSLENFNNTQTDQVLQFLINRLHEGPQVHRLLVNLQSFPNPNLLSTYLLQAHNLTSLRVQGGNLEVPVVALLTALQGSNSLALLEIYYLGGNNAFMALARLIRENQSIRVIKLRLTPRCPSNMVRAIANACGHNQNIVNFFGFSYVSVQRYIWRNWYRNVVKRTYLETCLRHSYRDYTRRYTFVVNKQFPVYVSGTAPQRAQLLNRLLFPEAGPLPGGSKFSSINQFLAVSEATSRQKLWRVINHEKTLRKLNSYDRLVISGNTSALSELSELKHLQPYFHMCSALSKASGVNYFSKTSYFQWAKQGLLGGHFFRAAKQGVCDVLSLEWMKDDNGRPSLAKFELTLLENVARVVGVDVEAIKTPAQEVRVGREFIEENYRMHDSYATDASFWESDLLLTEVKEEFDRFSSLFRMACGYGLHIMALSPNPEAFEEELNRVSRICRNVARNEQDLMLVLHTGPDEALLEHLEGEIQKRDFASYPGLLRNKRARLSFFPFQHADSKEFKAIKRTIARAGNGSPVCQAPIELFLYRILGFLLIQAKSKAIPVMTSVEAMSLLEAEFPNAIIEELEEQLALVVAKFSPMGHLVAIENGEGTDLLVFDKEWLLDRVCFLCFLSEERLDFIIGKANDIDPNFGEEVRTQLEDGILNRDLVEVLWSAEERQVLRIFATQSLLLHELKDEHLDRESHFLCSSSLRKASASVLKSSLDFVKLKAVFSANSKVFANEGVFHRLCTMFQPHARDIRYFDKLTVFNLGKVGSKCALLFAESSAELELVVESSEEFQGVRVVEMVRSFIKYISEAQYGLNAVYSTHLESPTGDMILMEEAEEGCLEPWFGKGVLKKESAIEHIRLSDVSSLL